MSQESDIIRHLKTKGPITPLEALREYGIMRLAARIGDLRSRGFPIATDIIEVAKGKRVARYRLA